MSSHLTMNQLKTRVKTVTHMAQLGFCAALLALLTTMPTTSAEVPPSPPPPLAPAPRSSPPCTLSPANYAQGALREKDTIQRLSPRLHQELTEKKLTLGAPIFIRIFKETRELELWIQEKEGAQFRHFKTWTIAAMSGQLGPKEAESDYQAPEGFYYVTPSRMKPDSRYHLAFNLGYPNRYDREHKRSGGFLMVHGNRVSIGCFAMTDASIEEIYTLCALALKNGQAFYRVHIFPYRMTELRHAQSKGNPHMPFWDNLKSGYDWFEKTQTPPDVSVKNKTYHFQASESMSPDH